MCRKSIFWLIFQIVVITLFVQSSFIANAQIQTLQADNKPEIEWTKTYGGPEGDAGFHIIQTTDDGFALSGTTKSFGPVKVRIIKTGSNGEIQWDRLIASEWGKGLVNHHSVIGSSDGGFLYAGILQDDPVKYNPFHGSIHLVKLDSEGNTQWNKTIDKGVSIIKAIEISDGGFVLTSNSYIDDEENWLMKIDNVGNLVWSQTFSESPFEGGLTEDIIETYDGGFAIIGSLSQVPSDVWILKTDSKGILEWNQTYGGKFNGEETIDYGRRILQTSNNEYVFVGTIKRIGLLGYNEDVWLVKTDSMGNHQWNKTYGGSLSEEGNDVIQTPDEGFIIAGFTTSFGSGNHDMWIVKTDSNGSKEWDITYGGPETDLAESIILTSDGGFAIIGSTESFGAGKQDMLLVKFTSTGQEEGKLSNFYGEYIVGGILLISTMGGGFYLMKQRNLKRFTGLLPNSITKETLKSIFNGNTSKYISLTAGFEKFYASKQLRSRVPEELFEYKFLMNPVRLAIMKILVEDNMITSRDLKNQLGLQWGDVSHHLAHLKKNNLLEIEERFVEGITMQTLLITPDGISRYESLIKILQKFLSSSEFEKIPVEFFDQEKN